MARVDDSSYLTLSWLLYFDRTKLLGEQASIDWMLGNYPEP